MQTKSFGANDVAIPILGLGCARIGSFNNPASPLETRRLLERALDLGVTVFDTADVYGQGDSERAIGRLLRNRRDAGFVVTKVGIRFSATMRLVRPLKPLLKPLLSATCAGRAGMTSLRQQVVDRDLSPTRIAAAVEASLRRLKMDVVDVLLLHGPPVDVVCDPRIVQALTQLRCEGKVRAFGISCDSAECLSASLRMPGLEAVEVTAAMLDSLDLTERETLAQRRIGVFLREVLRERGSLAVERMIADATRREEVTCTIVGTTSGAHLAELAAAANA